MADTMPPPALEHLEPHKLVAFRKGGKAQVAFTKRMNDSISELFSCVTALGKTATLLILEDGSLMNLSTLLILIFNFSGDYNGQVFSPDYKIFVGARDKKVGSALHKCVLDAENATEDDLFSTQNLKKYTKQLKVLYGLPADG